MCRPGTHIFFIEVFQCIVCLSKNKAASVELAVVLASFPEVALDGAAQISLLVYVCKFESLVLRTDPLFSQYSETRTKRTYKS